MTLRTGVQPRTGPRAPRAIPADALRSLVAAHWVRPAARAAVGAVVLGAIVARVGAEPFLRGLAALDGTVLAAAVGLSAVATAAAAWRWRAIATRLGAPIGWPAAVGMYYRSQFLNSVLPGGVLGDVHRAVDHGRGGARAAAARGRRRRARSPWSGSPARRSSSPSPPSSCCGRGPPSPGRCSPRSRPGSRRSC